MKFALTFLTALLAVGQTVTVAAQSGTSSQSTQLQLVAKSTTTFTLSGGTASTTGAATLNLSASTTRVQVQPIALSFTVNWLSADVSGVSVGAGAALNGLGKTFTCAVATATSQSCTISGGTATIPNGVIAQVFLTANKTTNLALSALGATNKFGVPLLTASAGTATVTMPVALASISCASPQIESGEQVVCTANLSQAAPAAGIVVQLSSSAPTSIGLISTAGVAISAITVPAGATAANFVAQGL